MAGGEDCCWIGALALIREGEQMEGHLLLNPTTTTTTKLNNLKCQCYIHTLLCKLDRLILVQTYRQDSQKRRSAKAKIERTNMKLQHSGDHIIEAQTGLGTDGS